jgi:cardiolipin synthase
MNKILRFIFSRKFIICVLAVAQMVIFNMLISNVTGHSSLIYIAMMIISVGVMFYILGGDSVNPSYKLIWVMVVLVLPITGPIFYRLCGAEKLSPKQRKRLGKIGRRASDSTPENKEEIEEIRNIDEDLAKRALFLKKMAISPPYSQTAAKYYPMGRDIFKDLIEDLKKAEKTIFIHYFIISKGKLWDKILPILKERAANGVDVRLIYDGVGSMVYLPGDYPEVLARYKIKAVVFNDMSLSVHIGRYFMMNHRDHRKSVVIDSNIAYGGGVNLADEYAGITAPYGVWKDTGYRIEGPGAYSATLIFLQTWEFLTNDKADYDKYRPTVKYRAKGFVQPYQDLPIDRINVCKNVYISAINNANRYVYLTSPYLAIDYEFTEALKLAAQSGIDVRVLVPGIPDKKSVYMVTQSYYRTLLSAGVKIYRYTPGFLHAKMYLADDNFAVVGSCNTDYRSMYLNFENCCAFYDCDMVADVKKDILHTMEQSKEITVDDVKKWSIFRHLAQAVMRVLAPLM